LEIQKAIGSRLDVIQAEIIELQLGQAVNQDLIDQIEQSFLTQAFRGSFRNGNESEINQPGLVIFS